MTMIWMGVFNSLLNKQRWGEQWDDKYNISYRQIVLLNINK